MKTTYTPPGKYFETKKVAWIRNDDIPPGQRAPGRFECPCGHTIRGVKFGQPQSVTCPDCGTIYNGMGWIIGHAPRPRMVSTVLVDDPGLD